MPFLHQVPDRNPYEPFATAAGLNLWPGGLTLVAAAPGVGKTSWTLDLAARVARSGSFAAFLCYEHTPAELRARLRAQTLGRLAGPHPRATNRDAFAAEVEAALARTARLFLDMPHDREDTPHRIEASLGQTIPTGPALVVVDYLQRVPFVDPFGRSLTLQEGRAGAVTAAFKRMALEHGWHVILIAALEKRHYTAEDLHTALQQNPASALAALLGDERVAYEADRVVVLFRTGSRACGCCYDGRYVVAKDRTGPVHSRSFEFWGRVFLPRIEGEEDA